MIINIHKRYLLKKYLKKILIVSGIFFILVLIINLIEEANFLKEVEKLCKDNDIIFILDEMITGFRWHLRGAQYIYNVDPDISTFGKAMANGFSVACVAGKKKIMELGSITNKKEERVFLLSTTHGAEMSSLGAFIKTVEFLKKNNTIQKNWNYGDYAPAESAWRRSSSYLFAEQVAKFLAKPSKYAGIWFDTSRSNKNNIGQWVYNGLYRQDVTNYIIPSSTVQTAGYINAISDYIKHLGYTANTYISDRFNNIAVQLSYKLGGFTNKDNFIHIDYDQYFNESMKVRNLLNDFKQKNVYRIYPKNFFCNTELQDKCTGHNQKDIYFIDTAHLSKKGSSLIGKELEIIIENIYKYK